MPNGKQVTKEQNLRGMTKIQVRQLGLAVIENKYRTTTKIYWKTATEDSHRSVIETLGYISASVSRTIIICNECS